MLELRSKLESKLGSKLGSEVGSKLRLELRSKLDSRVFLDHSVDESQLDVVDSAPFQDPFAVVASIG